MNNIYNICLNDKFGNTELLQKDVHGFIDHYARVESPCDLISSGKQSKFLFAK